MTWPKCCHRSNYQQIQLRTILDKDPHMVFCALASEVGNEIVDVNAVSLERAAGRDVEVANDLVDVDFARDIAALGVLLLDLL